MSNTVNVYVIVEGQTEQSFVRNILAPYLSINNIFLFPSLVGKPGHKGGHVTLERAMTDIGNFLKQRHDTIITTMLDYYGLEDEDKWPGRKLNENERRALSAIQKAQRVETGLFELIQNEYPKINVAHRFIPFFIMHEFEALLFSDPTVLARKLAVAKDSIQQILDECGTPEEINDSVNNAPSRRLNQLINGKYRKTTQGIAIANEIGLEQIRQKCPHFDEWLQKVESCTLEN